MRVLSVTPEFFPLLKTGGLADVTGALPLALAPLGVEVRTLLPAYPEVLDGARPNRRGGASGTLLGASAAAARGAHGGRCRRAAARRAASLRPPR